MASFVLPQILLERTDFDVDGDIDTIWQCQSVKTAKRLLSLNSSIVQSVATRIRAAVNPQLRSQVRSVRIVQRQFWPQQ